MVITVIITNAELIQNPDYDDTNRATFASNILVMSKQMRNLVEQMLELARADSVQHNTVFSSVDFSRLVWRRRIGLKLIWIILD